ncbi:MAG: DUF1772 domain-containing protein [Betaproteobacteria bacterium]|nr:DUF1772 domain-containing protein [Betaproteobacteria bacterium]
MNASSLIPLLATACALGSGLMAGFFFAFSVCTMKALGALPPEQGISAMQSINVTVINRWFLVPFFGVAGLTLVLSVMAVLHWYEPGSPHVVAGGLFYFIGTFLVTVLFNVPRNRRLASVSPASSEGAALWVDYLIAWTRWNHVRTIAALAGAASFTIALARWTPVRHSWPW